MNIRSDDNDDIKWIILMILNDSVMVLNILKRALLIHHEAMHLF